MRSIVEEHYGVKPTRRIQAYLTKEEFEKVRELASNMGTSISQLVKKAIMDLKRLEEEAYEKGFDEGFEGAGKEVEEFTVPCPKCKKPMLFSSRFKEEWESEVKPILVKVFFDWAHVECLEKAKRLGSQPTVKITPTATLR